MKLIIRLFIHYNFRSFEDARDALHSKSRIILFDKPAMVEAVYEPASREEYESREKKFVL